MSDPSKQDPASASNRSWPQAPEPITDPAHQLPEHATGVPAKSSPVRKIVVVLIVLAIAAFIWWRIHSNNAATAEQANKAAAAANRPTSVQTVTVQQKTVPVFLTALGTVTAYNSVTINTRVSGQLLQVNFTEGQAVRKGQLLLQIDPRPYQAALDQAAGQLAKDEANLKDMQAEAERYTALYQAGVVSKEQQQLEINNAGQAAGSIKADEAAVEAAKVNLGYTKIYSPIDGVVGLRQVDPGNIINSGQSTGLVIINQIHPIGIIFTLPEDQLPQVQTAMKGGKKLVVEAYDRTDAHKIAAGTLLTIDNQIDTTTGTAKLKAVFDNTDSTLFANQFVNIRLILSERPNATVVPTAAIESGNQGDYVFVVNPGPTPPDKVKNLPGAGATGTTGAKSKGGGKSKTAATDTTGETGATGAPGSNGSGHQGCPAGQMHADAVPVHVDFTIGTASVLSDGALNSTQNVVVDGQEKLVDGSPVCPQPAKPTTSVPATSGVTGSSGPSGATGSQSPSSPVGGHHQSASPGGPAQ